jgi:hypothetical protein
MFCILEVVQLSGCKHLTQMHAGQHLDHVIPSPSILHGDSCGRLACTDVTPDQSNLPIRYFPDHASTCAARDIDWMIELDWIVRLKT